jgi:hypothetical protein
MFARCSKFDILLNPPDATKTISLHDWLQDSDAHWIGKPRPLRKLTMLSQNSNTFAPHIVENVTVTDIFTELFDHHSYY